MRVFDSVYGKSGILGSGVYFEMMSCQSEYVWSICF